MTWRRFHRSAEHQPGMAMSPLAILLALCVTLCLAQGVATAAHAAPQASTPTAAAAPPPTALPRAAPDPFYQRLLRDGIAAQDRGELNRAIKNLRLASFGFLDNTPRLVETLTRLAIAQQSAGDLPGFRETFRRIAEVEQRFPGSWIAADVDATRRQTLTDLAAVEVSAAVLDGIDAFQGIARRQVVRELDALSGTARLSRLQRQVQIEPDVLLWRVELADAFVAESRPADAVETLDVSLDRELTDTLQHSPLHQRALCLRGEALSAIGQARRAADDLSRCPSVTSTMHFARALLASYLTLGDLDPADALLPTLDPEVREHRDIRRLSRELVEARERAQEAAAQEAAVAQAEQGPAVVPETATTELPGIASSQLGRARQLNTQARRASDLREPMALALEVADAYPAHVDAQHLVAEIAYRSRQWQQAVTYYERGGPPGDDEPYQQFFYAVALYEAGRNADAADTLRRALPNIQRDEFIDGYAARILDGR